MPAEHPSLGGSSQGTAPRHPERPRKHQFWQKMRNFSVQKLLFFPSSGAWQLQPAPAAGKALRPCWCATKQLLQLLSLVLLLAFNKINRKWHPINCIKTFRWQITRCSLRNGRFMLPHRLYPALPGLWHVFQLPWSNLLFQTLWALSKIRAQRWKISVGRNPACIELKLHKELQI